MDILPCGIVKLVGIFQKCDGGCTVTQSKANLREGQYRIGAAFRIFDALQHRTSFGDLAHAAQEQPLIERGRRVVGRAFERLIQIFHCLGLLPEQSTGAGPDNQSVLALGLQLGRPEQLNRVCSRILGLTEPGKEFFRVAARRVIRLGVADQALAQGEVSVGVFRVAFD